MNPALRDIILESGQVAPAFVPTDIAGLSLWLDAADAATITLDGSNNVSEWRDKSGSAMHAAQSTTTRRPSYTSSNQINGINCPRFDGTDDYLATPSFTVLQPSTQFYVVRRAANGIQVVIDSVGGRNQFLFNSNPGYMYAGSSFTGVATVTPGVTYRITSTFNGASSTIRLNGVLDKTGNAGTSSKSGSTVIGIGNNLSSFPMNGMIAEVLVYSGLLSGGQIASVQSYLLAKWGT